MANPNKFLISDSKMGQAAEEVLFYDILLNRYPDLVSQLQTEAKAILSTHPIHDKRAAMAYVLRWGYSKDFPDLLSILNYMKTTPIKT